MLGRAVASGASAVKEGTAAVYAEAVIFTDVAVEFGEIVAGDVGDAAAYRADEVVVVARAIARVTIEGGLAVAEMLLQKSAVKKSR